MTAKLTISALLLLSLQAIGGCIPVIARHGAPQGRIAHLKVPAQAGLTVEVPAATLLTAFPTRPDDGPIELQVSFRGDPVSCVLRGGADGRLDPGDALVFQVQHTNRHSAWLSYRVTRLNPDATAKQTCARKDQDAAKPTLATRMLGRFVATAVPPRAAPDAPLSTDPHTWARWRDADYLLIAPRPLLPAMAPLIAHRERLGHRTAQLAAEDIFERLSDGNPDPAAIRDAIRAVHAHSGGRLRYVLLVSDVRATSPPSVAGLTPVPTFYAAKVPYQGFTVDHELATDYPYALPIPSAAPNAAKPVPDIAVGRLPAQTAAEAHTMVQKIIAYETTPGRPGVDPAWRRRLVLFGGPANFGDFVDSLVENVATNLLNQRLPYDWDLRLIFAKPQSPYASRFDRLGQRIRTELDRGALFAAYFGHGLEESFDLVPYRGRYYEFGNARDMAKLNTLGAPVFVSFTCHTGRFDTSDGRPSLAEAMLLAPHGPVAVFAASRASHPYPNALYAQAFIDDFLKGRPDTLGDGLLTLKRDMAQRSMPLAELLVGQPTAPLKTEHERLYNLLGDPATELQYPDRASVRAKLLPHGQLRVTVRAPNATHVKITLETDRGTIHHKLISPARIAKLSKARAFAAMDKNLEAALDKVLVTRTEPIKDGLAQIQLDLPALRTSPLIIKALATGPNGQVAVGHARLTRPQ